MRKLYGVLTLAMLLFILFQVGKSLMKEAPVTHCVTEITEDNYVVVFPVNGGSGLMLGKGAEMSLTHRYTQDRSFFLAPSDGGDLFLIPMGFIREDPDCLDQLPYYP